MSTNTREDVIKLAREAGFVVDDESRKHQPNCIFHTHHLVDDLLERFHQLAVAKAVAEEREACAKVCESEPERIRGDGIRAADQLACAAAIRARSNT